MGSNKKVEVLLRLILNIAGNVRFEKRHKVNEQVFTRERKLPFRTVLKLLLRKSVKSLQVVLNEWCENLDYEISASALSQARRKLRHTAFIELLEKSVVQVMYRVGEHQRYKGKRLLAVDGTSLRLPNTTDLRKKFGLVVHMQSKRQVIESNQVEAKATVLYDVLNEIPISADLAPGRKSDLFASRVHLKHLKANDVVIADRGFGSYQFFAEILANKADFLIRLRKNAFSKYHKLSNTSDIKECTIELARPYHLRKVADVPASIVIRFLLIHLDNGELEYLATSLTDIKMFPYEEFKKLYYKRWGIETYFHVLKSHLTIDNFTGKSVEAILQDFHSTIFVSGLETIISAQANQQLAGKNTQYKQKVNKAIAFHTIKNKVVKLIFDMPPDALEQIQKLFLQTPTLIRPNKPKPPRTPSAIDNKIRNSLYFQRYARKHVF